MWLHAGLAVAAHDGVDLIARGGDASEMRGRHQLGLGENALHRRVRALARRAAGAIGDGDELRRQRLQPLDRFPQRLFHLLGGGRKEFERHRDAAVAGRHETAEARTCSSYATSRRGGDIATRAGIAREPERHRDLAVAARLGRQTLDASAVRARTPSSIASPSPAQSRAGDARAARAGIPCRAARSRPPAAARPDAARAPPL